MNVIDGILNAINNLTKRIGRLEVQGYGQFIPLTTPLTSTSWDGDSFSTTAKTKIDLSAVFGAPAGIKAVLCNAVVADLASATNSVFLILSPNDTSSSGIYFRFGGITNSYYHSQTMVIPCDVNGDIYYQTSASGASQMYIYLEIWGYWI
jgi:hypothetical protein